MEFEDNLWLPFIDQTQSGILVCAIITFHIYNIRAIKCEHGIGTNDIILFNEQLEILSTSIIELVNIYESSHKEAVVNLITSKDLNTRKKVLYSKRVDSDLNCPPKKKVYITILIDSWSLGGKPIYISIMNIFKLVMLKL